MTQNRNLTNKLIALTCVFLFFVPFLAFAQNDQVNSLLHSISEKYKIEDGNVVIQKVIEFENISKDNLYLSAKEYLTSNYGSFKEVLQVDDKENGLIIIKGLFADIYCNDEKIFGYYGIEHKIWHILKIDIKDNRVRLTISMNKVEYRTAAVPQYNIQAQDYVEYLTEYCPIKKRDVSTKPEKRKCDCEGYVFYKAINRALNTIDSMELFIKKSSLKIRQNDDW